MYDNRRLKFFPSQPEVDIYQIIREAQSRWLRPVEVIEILRNYQKFRLNPVPPNKPPSGSLFLFDRKTLRFFRKDGHNWRKKKDGKTVREAHERLKAGSVDVLHCYYAHGEDNPNFQRRSYWMLEGAYEHIVLVHYREVTEGSRSSIYRSIQEASTNKDNVTQSTNLGRPTTLGVPICANSPGISETEVTGPYKSPEPSGTPVESEETDSADEGDNDDNPSTALVENQHTSLLQQVSGSRTSMHHGAPFDHNLSNLTCVQAKQDVGLEQLQAGLLTAKQPVNQGPSGTGEDLNNVDFEDLLKNPDAYLGQKSISPAVTLDVVGWNALLETFRGTGPIESTAKSGEQQSTSLGHGYRPPQSSLNTMSSDRSNNTFNGLPLNRISAQNVGMQCLKPPEVQHMEVDVRHLCVQQQQANPSVEYQNLQHENLKSNEESNALKKLDSFGRWMSREIGEDSQSSLLSGSTDHGAYWTLEDHSTLDEISSFSHQMQLDVGLSPSLSHDQQFSIVDFSPDWAFSSEETKVIVAGNFLKEGTNTTWYCMFGEVEVPAELIHEGVLRCKAPPHAPGRVPLYITPGNRLACSEVREFEYRAAASDSLERAAVSSTSSQIQDEFLQMRFARLISFNSEETAAKSDLLNKVQPAKIQGLTLNLEKQWEDIETRTRELGPDTKEWVLETLLRQQLQRWLMSRVSEDGNGASVLDTHGQGVLHLAAALGYDWAIPATLASGVGINFRDIHGWTALHWAAYHGREKVVSTLLAAGASPGLVTDPTPQYPSGRTPADLAASSGHKGMAGYLAEMSLTSHLTALTLKERNTNEIDSYSAVLAEEKAVELISEKGGIDQTVKGPDEHTMFQDSLRAVRNAARAAALIHASFRQESFKRRQEKLGAEVVDGYGMSLDEVKTVASLHADRGHRKEPLHSAATRIQQKFRGWKGRRDFLLLRQRVVRIQAHVRGHQVRRKFRKFLWSVGILDKVVLRWRRKRTGLRNFHASGANKETENSDDDEVLKVGRKQKEAAMQKAVTRVQSMVRSHQAREQYQRIQEGYLRAVAGDRAGVQTEDESMFASGD